MPTRDRAATAYRAADTFLTALSRRTDETVATLVIADDSTHPQEARHLGEFALELAARHPSVSIEVVVVAHKPECTIAEPGGGPGAARNRALAALRRSCPEADVTVMLDDDVCFADAVYRGSDLHCDGTRLLEEALVACTRGRAVAGCSYVGRQDLSMLEHATLDDQAALDMYAVRPATDRKDVAHVAPGNISTAFLAIAAPPAALPTFPEHYNEDYVWLHAMQRNGWDLQRVTTPLIHAPPGEVVVTSTNLSFQVHGEIVWLAVLERERFPVTSFSRMASAVREIAGDVRAAFANPKLAKRPVISGIMRDVLDHYEAIGRQFAAAAPGAHADRLIKDIRRGLNLRP